MQIILVRDNKAYEPGTKKPEITITESLTVPIVKVEKPMHEVKEERPTNISSIEHEEGYPETRYTQY